MDINRSKVETPKTDSGHILSAEIEHENTLREFVRKTELGVLDKDQMGVIALINAGSKIGIQLTAAKTFFVAEDCSIRSMSSGEGGIGRIQAKECITAGAFPMSLLFGSEKSGMIDMLKSFIPGAKKPEAGK
jgi:hypothetical protein